LNRHRKCHYFLDLAVNCMRRQRDCILNAKLELVDSADGRNLVNLNMFYDLSRIFQNELALDSNSGPKYRRGSGNVRPARPFRYRLLLIAILTAAYFVSGKLG